MERAKVERYLVIVLFVLVLVVFSFAERDSKKLDRLYTNVIEAGQLQYLAKTGNATPAASYK